MFRDEQYDVNYKLSVSHWTSSLSTGISKKKVRTIDIIPLTFHGEHTSFLRYCFNIFAKNATIYIITSFLKRLTFIWLQTTSSPLTPSLSLLSSFRPLRPPMVGHSMVSSDRDGNPDTPLVRALWSLIFWLLKLDLPLLVVYSGSKNTMISRTATNETALQLLHGTHSTTAKS